MKLTLRARIVLTLLPLLALLAILGGSAIVLLHQLGNRIDAILRDNYDSVIYMERLKEALERIDSSYTFALAGQEKKARDQYKEQWEPFEQNLLAEQGNITLPGEKELVGRLTVLTERYRKRGDAFYAQPADHPARHEIYFGSGGLFEMFKEIKDIADAILRLNQNNMEQASRDAIAAGQESFIGFVIGLALVALLGIFLAWQTIATILQPIRAVIQSAKGIRAGNLD